jgi:hypothetical protein
MKLKDYRVEKIHVLSKIYDGFKVKILGVWHVKYKDNLIGKR